MISTRVVLSAVLALGRLSAVVPAGGNSYSYYIYSYYDLGSSYSHSYSYSSSTGCEHEAPSSYSYSYSYSLSYGYSYGPCGGGDSDTSESSDTCDHISVTLTDAFGDGWGDYAYTVTDTNGELQTSGTLENYAERTDQLCLVPGTYTFVVDGSGSWPSEIGYSFCCITSSDVGSEIEFTMNGDGTCGTCLNHSSCDEDTTSIALTMTGQNEEGNSRPQHEDVWADQFLTNEPVLILRNCLVRTHHNRMGSGL